MNPHRVLYCHCAFAQVVPSHVKADVLEGLTASGRSFEAVPDLCEMSARRDPALAEIAASGDAVIVACYPRAVQWLFSGAGVPLADGVRILNMRAESAEQVLARIDGRVAEPPAVEPDAPSGAAR